MSLLWPQTICLLRTYILSLAGKAMALHVAEAGSEGFLVSRHFCLRGQDGYEQDGCALQVKTVTPPDLWLSVFFWPGADINTQASDSASALYEACKNQHEEVVAFLLSQGADANKADKDGMLPLHVASKKGSDRSAGQLGQGPCPGSRKVKEKTS